MNTIYISFFNFSLLVILLVVKLKQPVRGFVQGRHDGIRNEIKSVHEQLIEAQKMYGEFTTKLSTIDQEVRTLKEQSKQDLAAATARILSEAERLSKEVVADAKMNSQSLVSELKNQLFAELGFQVLDRAEVILRNKLTGDDRVRIRQEFSKQLEAVQ